MKALVVWMRERVGTLRKGLLAFLGLLLLVDFLLPRHHPHYWFDEVFCFWAAFGTAGCFLLAKVAKGAAHLFLSKGEDYYGQW